MPIESCLMDYERYPIFDKKEQIELAYKAKNGDSEARNALINSCLRLVISIVNKTIYHPGNKFWDLVQEGNLGLLESLDFYKPERGSKFSSYCSYRIAQRVRRYWLSDQDFIKIPDRVVNLSNRVWRERNNYINNYGVAPSDEELTEIINSKIQNKDKNISENRVRNAIKLRKMMQPVSLDEFIRYKNQDRDIKYSELVSDQKVIDEERVAIRSKLKAIFEKSFDVLSPRERYVIIQRFGMEGGVEKTLEEVSNNMFLSKNEVMDIKKSALKKLREYFEIVDV